MPWKESKAMDLRVQLIHDYNEGESVSALAEIYAVSRKTVYKWLERHETGGVAALADRRRTPHHSPSKLSDEILAHILAARQRWNWGPRKLRVKLAAAHPDLVWPAESTLGEVLKRAGLTHQRRRQPCQLLSHASITPSITSQEYARPAFSRTPTSSSMARGA